MSSDADFELTIPADMTIYEAGEIKDLFANALVEDKNINVNLSNVSEIDSAGLQLMVSLKKEAEEKEKAVQFASHSTAVIGLLDLYGMTSYFGDPVVMDKTS